MPPAVALPTFESQLAKIAAAERDDGWLSVCQRDGRYLILTQQFAKALSEFLRRLGAGPVLEVCAGRGELAETIRSAGVHVVAIDADPPEDAAVIRASAQAALRRYRPRVVLGSFVPIDAGVDERVMGFSSVQHYVMLGARIGGHLGSAALWRNPAWFAEPVEQITRWMLTRHDVLIGKPQQPIVQHGETWHFYRNRNHERDEPISE